MNKCQVVIIKKLLAKMPKRRSQTERATYAVKRRKEEYEAKRFNKPLKIFLERKYPEILKEFTGFYNFVDFVNPGKKDLTRTTTFKQWLAENPTPPTILSITPSVNRETDVLSPTTANTSANSEENVSPPANTSANSEENVSPPANTSANRETISDILDELFGPDGLPDEILPNEDEGIELNHFDELAFDIEPFDFLSEVEEF